MALQLVNYINKISQPIPLIESKIEGVYVAEPNIDTFDTQILNSKGEYIYVIYWNNNSFVYRNIGKWKITDDRLVLTDFLLNKDQIYDEGIKKFDNELFSFSFSYKIISNKVTVSFGERENDHYYQSVK